jgi:repressor LexA
MPERLTERQREILQFISASIDERGYPPTLREIGEHFGIRSTNGVNDHLKALEKKGYLKREDLKSRAMRPVEARFAAAGIERRGLGVELRGGGAVSRESAGPERNQLEPRREPGLPISLEEVRQQRAASRRGEPEFADGWGAAAGLGRDTGRVDAGPVDASRVVDASRFEEALRRAAELEAELCDIPILGRVAAGQPLLAVENQEDRVRVDRFFVGTHAEVFGLRVCGDSMIEDGILDGDFVFVKKTPAASRGDIVVAMIEGEATLKRYYPEGDMIRFQPANSNMEPIFVRKQDFRSVDIIGVVVGVYRRLQS